MLASVVAHSVRQIHAEQRSANERRRRRKEDDMARRRDIAKRREWAIMYERQHALAQARHRRIVTAYLRRQVEDELVLWDQLEVADTLQTLCLMTLARNIRAVDLESLPLDFVDRLYGVIARCYPELLADLSVIQLFMRRLGLSDDNDHRGACTSADARAAELRTAASEESAARAAAAAVAAQRRKAAALLKQRRDMCGPANDVTCPRGTIDAMLRSWDDSAVPAAAPTAPRHTAQSSLDNHAFARLDRIAQQQQRNQQAERERPPPRRRRRWWSSWFGRGRSSSSSHRGTASVAPASTTPKPAPAPAPGQASGRVHRRSQSARFASNTYTARYGDVAALLDREPSELHPQYVLVRGHGDDTRWQVRHAEPSNACVVM